MGAIDDAYYDQNFGHAFSGNSDVIHGGLCTWEVRPGVSSQASIPSLSIVSTVPQ
jgi:hypothetical protein